LTKDRDFVKAMAQAAHDVLVAIYPKQQTKLDVELQKWLNKVSDNQSRYFPFNPVISIQ